MDKSPDAFRTISEVAEALDAPAHVLRFWESRFPQIRPVKRAGGRRYYRPADVALLTGIKRLLHDEGMTIRGVQKVLREQGIRHVAALAGVTDDDLTAFDEGAAIEAALAAQFSGPDPVVLPAEAEVALARALETALSAEPLVARTSVPVAVAAPGAESDPISPPPRALFRDRPADPAPEAPIHLDAEEEAPARQGVLALRSPLEGSAPAPSTAPTPDATPEPAPEPAPGALQTRAGRLRGLRKPLLPATIPALALQRDRLALLLARISRP